MSNLPPWMQSWRAELQAKPWLRLALGGAVLLLAALALLELEAWLHGARQNQQQLQREMARMQAMAGEAEWRQQRNEVFARLAAARERSWREESEGRMQALMQDWVREQLAGHGLVPRELAAVVLPPAQTPGGATGVAAQTPDTDLRLVRVRTAFDFEPDRLHALLADLQAQPQAVQVVRLSVANGTRRNVDLELEAVFVLATRSTP